MLFMKVNDENMYDLATTCDPWSIGKKAQGCEDKGLCISMLYLISTFCLYCQVKMPFTSRILQK